MIDYKQLATDYIKLDKNPSTRREIQQLLESDDQVELEDRLCSRLGFGTAGLRACMGAGYSRMNELTVIQATQGLCSYLKSTNFLLSTQGIVIGHDHRLNSNEFAKVTAAVFLSQGIKVYYYTKLVHTPLVPFAVEKLNAACGIMITASHNPKQDNGYKVYWSNACQIIPPHDTLIAQSIEENLEPMTWDKTLVDTCSLCIRDSLKQVEDDYFKALANQSVYKNTLNHQKNVQFCYTAMHGVGHSFAQKAFESFQLCPFIAVEEQKLPDPEFPTVQFPNPEEKGALDLAIKTAENNGAQIILANDPDADRLAVAEKQKNGKWYIFSGNELGIILGSLLIKRAKDRDAYGKYAMVASTVSSQMLGIIAKSEGFFYKDTLTGFKWMGNEAIKLSDQGYKVLFAFEEAIGYMVSDTVPDKDGISAMAVLAEELNRIYPVMNAFEYLESVYSKYGYSITNNSYLICHDKQLINQLFQSMRSFNGQMKYPNQIGAIRVTAVRDLTVGYDSETPDHKPLLPLSKEMITFKLENDSWITVRTSGTEPKIKYYSEIFSKNKDSARVELDQLIETFVNQVLKPELHGLEFRK